MEYGQIVTVLQDAITVGIGSMVNTAFIQQMENLSVKDRPIIETPQFQSVSQCIHHSSMEHFITKQLLDKVMSHPFIQRANIEQLPICGVSIQKDILPVVQKYLLHDLMRYFGNLNLYQTCRRYHSLMDPNDQFPSEWTPFIVEQTAMALLTRLPNLQTMVTHPLDGRSIVLVPGTLLKITNDRVPGELYFNDAIFKMDPSIVQQVLYITNTSYQRSINPISRETIVTTSKFNHPTIYNFLL